jgi:hypothetical protein
MKNQKGNALFLILIAVVLFAALSYAITQSDRGGGNVSDETNAIASTTILQYASAVASGVMRMQLRGISLDDIEFDEPPDSENEPNNQVFHPLGGGVAWQNVDPNTIVPDSPTGYWSFKGTEIEDIGTSESEMMIRLYGVRKGVCEEINKRLTGSDKIPLVTTVGSRIQDSDVAGLLSICYELADTPGTYVYYSVLVPR